MWHFVSPILVETDQLDLNWVYLVLDILSFIVISRPQLLPPSNIHRIVSNHALKSFYTTIGHCHKPILSLLPSKSRCNDFLSSCNVIRSWYHHFYPRYKGSNYYVSQYKKIEKKFLFSRYSEIEK